MSIFDMNKLVDQAQVKDGFDFLYCSKITDDTWFEQLEKNFPIDKCIKIITEINTREDGSTRLTDKDFANNLVDYLEEKNIRYNRTLIYLILICMLAGCLDEQYLQGLYNRCLGDKIIKGRGWVSVKVNEYEYDSNYSSHIAYIKISINYAVSQSLTIVLQGK